MSYPCSLCNYGNTALLVVTLWHVYNINTSCWYPKYELNLSMSLWRSNIITVELEPSQKLAMFTSNISKWRHSHIHCMYYTLHPKQLLNLWSWWYHFLYILLVHIPRKLDKIWFKILSNYCQSGKIDKTRFHLKTIWKPSQFENPSRAKFPM